MNHPGATDRIRGALLGLAWGDAFGCPLEMWRPAEIARVFGAYDALPSAFPRGILTISAHRRRMLRPLGLYSDDAQQAIALLGCCMEEPLWLPRRWGIWLVYGMAGGVWRDYGKSFSESVARLRDGVPHNRSGRFSAGIGAAMRTGPLGALYHDDLGLLRQVVCESSAVTHADVRAIASAYAVSLAVAWLVLGHPVKEIRQRLPAAICEVESEWLQESIPWRICREDGHAFSDVLRMTFASRAVDADALASVVERAAADRIEQKGSVHANQGQALLGCVHAIATALMFDEEPVSVIARLVRQGFDTDTVAAIAGCLCGARYGDGWIPVTQVFDHERLVRWADAIVTRGPSPEGMWDFFNNEKLLTELSTGYDASEDVEKP